MIFLFCKRKEVNWKEQYKMEVCDTRNCFIQ